MGLVPPPGSIIHLALSQTITANQGLGYEVEVGLLEAALRERGIRTWTIGNGDTPGSYLRPGVLVAMDGSGLVLGGDVGRALLIRDDPAWPYGWRTDYEALAGKLREGLAEADFIVVYLGDLARLESYRDLFLPERLAAFRRLALIHIDAFLSELWEMALDRDALVTILAPQSPSRECGGPKPSVNPHRRPFPKHRGLLSSPTTRQGRVSDEHGFCSNGPRLVWPPRPFIHTRRPDDQPPRTGSPLEVLRQMWTRIRATYDQRLTILKNYVIIQIPIYLVVVLLLWMKRIPSSSVLVFKTLLLSLMAVPLVLLLLAVQEELTITAAVLVLGSLGLGALAARMSRGKGFVFLSLPHRRRHSMGSTNGEHEARQFPVGL